MTIIRRIRAIIGALCIVVTLVSSRIAGQELPTAKPEDVGVSPDKVEELSTYMQSLVDKGKIAGGVTMFARHGKVVHLKAVGMADLEAKKPMKTDAIFRIASMTKPITSVAVMLLYGQGKLKLDDPVSKYIPEFKNMKVLVNGDPTRTKSARNPITIHHLLTHTSGLASCFNETLGPVYAANGIEAGLSNVQRDLEQTVITLAGLPLLFEPGEGWEYGISSDVLGRVIEVASRMSLDRFLEDEVCAPLGMKDTHFNVPNEKLPRLAAAYIPVDTCIRKVKQGERLRQEIRGKLVPISSDYCYGNTNNFLSGGGGLCSTASDFMRFCQMLLNGGELNGVRLLKEDTVKSMIVDQTGDVASNFGFGFRVYADTPNVHAQLRGMYSWGGYWTACFRVSPRGDWILVTMSQLAWDDETTRAWFAEYEKLAADAVMNGAPQ